jgi:hypothetical protein
MKQDVSPPHGRSPGRLQFAALVIAGLALAWLVLSRTLAAYLATTAPEAALLLQPNEPTALVSLAERGLNAAIAAKDQDAPKATDARRALEERDLDRLSGLARLAEQAMKGQSEGREQPSEPPAPVPAPPAPSQAAPLSTTPKLPPTPTSDLSLDDVRALAARAVTINPLDANAMGILARAADISGDAARAEILMRQTARLSFRESYAVYWLLEQAERSGDWNAVLRHGDTLMRTRLPARPFVIPYLARLAEQKDHSAAFIETLAAAPPWRQEFMRGMTTQITDARTPLNLLLALQSTPNPPSIEEQTAYIQFLISRKFHELAYYTWLQFQPREELSRIGPLYNRDFEKPLSRLPFDWTLPTTSSAVAEIRPLPDMDDNRALVVEFSQGRAAYSGVSQMTLAAPGTYVVKGRYRGRLVGTRGLAWRVLCADSLTPLGQSTQILGDAPDWREFSFTFEIPAKGCRAQMLRLDLDARSASETLVTGTMWFDDLEMSRGG